MFKLKFNIFILKEWNNVNGFGNLFKGTCILTFIKNPEIKELDLSNKEFYITPKLCNSYYSLICEYPKYYPDSTSAKKNIFRISKKTKL